MLYCEINSITAFNKLAVSAVASCVITPVPTAAAGHNLFYNLLKFGMCRTYSRVVETSPTTSLHSGNLWRPGYHEFPSAIQTFLCVTMNLVVVMTTACIADPVGGDMNTA